MNIFKKKSGWVISNWFTKQHKKELTQLNLK